MRSSGFSASNPPRACAAGRWPTSFSAARRTGEASAWPKSRSRSTTRSGALHTDAAEVQITRRVYRDGEGEYLINGQPCRLKDIKDLFLGTGAGTDAYGIIEQGRVDVLLASVHGRDGAPSSRKPPASAASRRRRSNRSAGWSASMRNLQRLNDILGEVENQLRSVRLQAAKAERYQEYTKRLREVRLYVGLREYRDLTVRSAEITTRARSLQDQLDAAAARSAEWSDEARRWETNLAELDAALRGEEGACAGANRQDDARHRSRSRARCHSAELGEEIARATDQFQTEHARIAETETERANAEREWSAVAEQCTQHREEAARLAELVAALRREQSATRKANRRRSRRALGATSTRRPDAKRSRQRSRPLGATAPRARSTHAQKAQASESLASLDLELETLSQADAELQVRLAAARQALADHSAALDDNRNQIEDWRRRLSDWRARHSGLVNRIEVLEALEQNHEGLGAGLRELLTSLEGQDGNADSLGDCVVGLVGNWLNAPRDVAHLLDIALGALAECVIVRDADRLVLALEERAEPFAGRIRFLPIQTATPTSFDCTIGCPPDVVRADRLLGCDHPELGGLAAQLLGTTWIVPNLAAARDLARRLPRHRFVTSAGEARRERWHDYRRNSSPGKRALIARKANCANSACNSAKRSTRWPLPKTPSPHWSSKPINWSAINGTHSKRSKSSRSNRRICASASASGASGDTVCTKKSRSAAAN